MKTFNPRRRVVLRQNAATGRVGRYGFGDCSPEHVFADAAAARAWLDRVGATCEQRIGHGGAGDEISGTYEYQWAIAQKGE